MRIALVLLPILLSGCAQAWMSAATTVGVISTEERTFGEAVDDGTIYTEINHYFLQKDVNDMLLNVNVMVRQGRVLLTGVVDSHQTVNDAVAMAWKANGVKEVISEMIVNPTGTVWDKTKDEWTEKQLEYRMFMTKGIHVQNYSVEVENSTAYLLGVALDEKELQDLIEIARTTKGVAKVVSHIKTKAQLEQLEKLNKK